MTSQPTSESVIPADRAEPFINDLNTSGQQMIANMSLKVNDIQFRRAMQIGYMMACQDFGLPTPEFEDPASGLDF